MRVFFDANILLDVIENRAGLVEESEAVLDRCDEMQAETFIAWHGLATAYYILKRGRTHAEATAEVELTSGHYAGSRMYALARHVSWFLDAEREQHAILVECEASNSNPPQSFVRLFGIDADGQQALQDALLPFSPFDWSAYS